MNTSTIILSCLCIIAATAVTSCTESGGSHTDAPPHVAEPATLVNFEVTGMHCTGCAATVRNTINRIDGVKRCTVSFEKSSAEVAIDIDSDEQRDEIIRKIVEKVTEDGFTIALPGTDTEPEPDAET